MPPPTANNAVQQLLRMLQPPSDVNRSRSRSPTRPRPNRQERVQHAVERTRQTAVTAAHEVAQQASLVNAELLKSLVERLAKIDQKLSAIDITLQVLREKIDPRGDEYNVDDMARE